MTRRSTHELPPIGGWSLRATAEVTGTRWQIEMVATAPGQLPVTQRVGLSSGAMTRYRGLNGTLAAMRAGLELKMRADPSVLMDADLLAQVAEGLPMPWALAAQQARRNQK